MTEPNLGVDPLMLSWNSTTVKLLVVPFPHVEANVIAGRLGTQYLEKKEEIRNEPRVYICQWTRRRDKLEGNWVALQCMEFCRPFYVSSSSLSVPPITFLDTRRRNIFQITEFWSTFRNHARLWRTLIGNAPLILITQRYSIQRVDCPSVVLHKQTDHWQSTIEETDRDGTCCAPSIIIQLCPVLGSSRPKQANAHSISCSR